MFTDSKTPLIPECSIQTLSSVFEKYSPFDAQKLPYWHTMATFISAKKGTLPENCQNTSILFHFMPFSTHLVLEFALLRSL
jgi:hypothetical protein